MLAALLRQQGRAARLRVGFAAYFKPDAFVDHWVCEIWDREGARWRLVDAELGEAQCRRFAIDFDPCDVPRDRFLPAGAVWQRCRAGIAEPESFGVLGIDARGLWFVASNLLRELAALNKVEMLPWDYWGPAVDLSRQGEIEPGMRSLLDELARRSSNEDPALEGLQSSYRENDGLAVPETILSYPNGRETWLDWQATL